ncbi:MULTISPECIES: ABC transporter substrate-binding protein [Paraburkholderia]|jgi:ribose transport system substrate-binding protein|uniref:Monosaccharide ABC transporter substrate-binding protein (CUT2 family) n=1 Tax=Paraburkholderia tropica TaxID=92647 RepID=A0A1A5X5W6_9BURK|nr:MULTISPECIES: ABC transporter substrate-binding protein [Paraburkholderia]RQM44780.1 ABC transporter [Paraburkholderia bannensis]MBB2983473.1 ribose transport system substrate-binding protein [Paraburkholderia tropica]MBB3001097.1 ribose transport system substrate-binding protein [Paraburkholderia tropica]MBB6320729.1 ribose transport system substrate-binding protein [Paraburkholderia tropica]MBN3814180.1 ABC transporter substrate-binding protein [Paraburkholderia sp. Ac-20347]
MLKKKTAVAVAVRTVAALALGCALQGAHAADKQLKSIGITVGSLGNPYFVTIVQGAEAKAKQINPNAKVTAVSADYDLNKQFTQIDNFISAHVDMILLNASDPKAIEPAVRKARAAGIVVLAVDVSAAGADATVQTDNVKAGAISCEYLAKKINGKGNVIIENGPQVSAVIDRVNGCKQVLAKSPGIKILSDDQDGKGSREGGMNTMQGYLTRFPKLDGVFTINDPQAIGSDLAAKQLHRSNIVITSVDGAPDIEAALKGDTLVQASASQDPWKMAQTAVQVGYDIMNGKKPANPMIQMTPALITRDNVGSYKGWTSPH